MTFSLHQGRVVMSNQITHTHTIINIHLAHIHDICSLILSSCAHFYRLSHPSPGDNHQSTGGRSVRTQGQAKMAALNSFSYLYIRALRSFRSFTQPPPSFLCCPRPPSHQPSRLTSVSLVLAIHLLPSTPFWPYGTHPFFPHAQTISILSDLLYSLLLFYSSSHTHLFIPNSIHS